MCDYDLAIKDINYYQLHEIPAHQDSTKYLQAKILYYQ